MSTTPSQTVDLNAIVNQLMPLVSVIMFMFILIALIKELRGAF